MNEQKIPLIKIEELVVKLNQYFGSDFSADTIKKLRVKKDIPAVDTRTPGTKMPRWKYNFEKVKNAMENLSQKD